MSDIPKQAEHAFERLSEMPCRVVSFSAYGAIQLGFGESEDHVIAGKYVKKRFQVEVGTYSSNWRYVHRERNKVAGSLVGARIVSMCAEQDHVVLTFDDGSRIEVEGGSAPDDAFYVHFNGGLSLFFGPGTGWILEEAAG